MIRIMVVITGPLRRIQVIQVTHDSSTYSALLRGISICTYTTVTESSVTQCVLFECLPHNVNSKRIRVITIHPVYAKGIGDEETAYVV